MIKLDVEEVLKIYRSILIRCPECNETMTPLGDGGIDPYHYCFDCKASIPFEDSHSLRKRANEVKE